MTIIVVKMTIVNVRLRDFVIKIVVIVFKMRDIIAFIQTFAPLSTFLRSIIRNVTMRWS